MRREEEDEHDAEHDAPVAYAVGDESLLRSVASLLAVSVVADEKVRAEADALPPDEHQQKIVRQHERQHHEHEEVQVSEEAVEASVAVHVAGGEDVYEEAYEGDEACVDSRKPVHRESEVRAEAADLNPSPEVTHHGRRRVVRQSRAARARSEERRVGKEC